MIRQDIPLHGRVVAITGGARGIGLATAHALAARGARVAIGDLDLDLARHMAQELHGPSAAVRLDVTDRGSFAAFLVDVERELGPLDVLVNNAGIMPLAHQVDEPDEAARRIVDINLHGVVTGTKLALGLMLPRRRGHIVNIASQAGRAAFGGVATYCASKFGVVGYSLSVADEVRDTPDLHITCVLPAVTRTELTDGLPKPPFLSIGPDDVALGIVRGLQRPKRMVYVPRTGGVILTVMNALPPRARWGLEKALRMEGGAMTYDEDARRAYEDRAAREVHGVREDDPRVATGTSGD